MKSMQDQALWYLINQKWSVIPVGINKTPLIDSWRPYQRQMPMEDEVYKWFSNPNAQIAVVTGQISGGLFIVDIDVDKNTGDFTKYGQELIDKYSKETMSARTGSGGVHLFFHTCPK